MEEFAVPRTRQGGSFVDAHKVKLHSNDFTIAEKYSQLSEEDKQAVQQYSSQLLISLEAHANYLQEERQQNNAVKQNATNVKSWDLHYQHSKFHFPLKNYIIHAFPVVKELIKSSNKECKWLMECGCGTGSTLLPLIRECTNGDVHFVGFDISTNALSIAKTNDVTKEALANERLYLFEYGEQWLCEKQNIVVNNAVISQSGDEEVNKHERKRQRQDDLEYIEELPKLKSTLDTVIGHSCIDIILLVFVLSALPCVDAMKHCLYDITSVMKADSVICVRDYAVYDNNYFRFRRRSEQEQNSNTLFFHKSDGTTQCFFTEEFLINLFNECGLVLTKSVCSNVDYSPINYHCNRLHNRKDGRVIDKVFINATFTMKALIDVEESQHVNHVKRL